MKQVILCIRCKHGVFINLPMDKPTALSFIDGWMEGKLKTTKEGMLPLQVLPDVHLCGIRVDEIVLMHTQEINTATGPTTGQTPPPWFGPRASGN